MGTAHTSELQSVRVDVWLWAVRQVKTRSMATKIARAGHVKVNGETAKASQMIKVGDEIRLRLHGWDRILKVKGLLVKRVGAPQAATCYDDLTPERPNFAKLMPIAVRERGTGRPTKKERRDIDALRWDPTLLGGLYSDTQDDEISRKLAALYANDE